MPAYTVERIHDSPILILRFKADFSVEHDLEQSIQDVRSQLDSADVPLFYVTDASGVQMDFEEFLRATNAISRGQEPLLHHPKIKRIVLVSSNMLFKLAAPGLNNPAFGNLKINAFDTLDAALAFCRQQEADF